MRNETFDEELTREKRQSREHEYDEEQKYRQMEIDEARQKEEEDMHEEIENLEIAKMYLNERFIGEGEDECSFFAFEIKRIESKISELYREIGH